MNKEEIESENRLAAVIDQNRVSPRLTPTDYSQNRDLSIGSLNNTSIFGKYCIQESPEMAVFCWYEKSGKNLSFRGIRDRMTI
jgi:hypothetical protein